MDPRLHPDQPEGVHPYEEALAHIKYNADFCLQMEAFRLDNYLADCRLAAEEVVDGRRRTFEYPAHRVVLAARSSFFRHLFAEKQQDSMTMIQLINCSPKALESVLHFLYTGQLNVNDSRLIDDVLAIARFCGILRLVDKLSSTRSAGTRRTTERCQPPIVMYILPLVSPVVRNGQTMLTHIDPFAQVLPNQVEPLTNGLADRRSLVSVATEKGTKHGSTVTGVESTGLGNDDPSQATVAVGNNHTKSSGAATCGHIERNSARNDVMSPQTPTIRVLPEYIPPRRCVSALEKSDSTATSSPMSDVSMEQTPNERQQTMRPTAADTSNKFQAHHQTSLKRPHRDPLKGHFCDKNSVIRCTTCAPNNESQPPHLTPTPPALLDMTPMLSDALRQRPQLQQTQTDGCLETGMTQASAMVEPSRHSPTQSQTQRIEDQEQFGYHPYYGPLLPLTSAGHDIAAQEEGDHHLQQCLQLPTNTLDSIQKAFGIEDANNTRDQTASESPKSGQTLPDNELRLVLPVDTFCDGEQMLPDLDKGIRSSNKVYSEKVPGGYRCRLCLRVYGRYSTISYHVTVFHRNPPARCDQPNCEFTTREGRYIHFHKYYRHGVPLPDSIDLGPRKCPMCSHVAVSRSTMEIHVGKKHMFDCSKVDGLYACPTCALTFPYLSEVLAHRVREHAFDKNEQTMSQNYLTAKLASTDASCKILKSAPEVRKPKAVKMFENRRRRRSRFTAAGRDAGPPTKRTVEGQDAGPPTKTAAGDKQPVAGAVNIPPQYHVPVPLLVAGQNGGPPTKKMAAHTPTSWPTSELKRFVCHSCSVPTYLTKDQLLHHFQTVHNLPTAPNVPTKYIVPNVLMHLPMNATHQQRQQQQASVTDSAVRAVTPQRHASVTNGVYQPELGAHRQTNVGNGESQAETAVQRNENVNNDAGKPEIEVQKQANVNNDVGKKEIGAPIQISGSNGVDMNVISAARQTEASAQRTGVGQAELEVRQQVCITIGRRETEIESGIPLDNANVVTKSEV